MRANQKRQFLPIAINGDYNTGYYVKQSRFFQTPLSKVWQKLPITVCAGIINLLLKKSTCDFCLKKDVLGNFVWFTKNIKRTFTEFIYSCILVFIYSQFHHKVLLAKIYQTFGKGV